MPLSSFVGSFSAGTGIVGSTIVVTGVGFQPKAIQFWWSGRSESTDTIGRASHYRGFGVAASPTDRRAITNNAVDAAAAADTQSAHSDAACILSVSAAIAIDGALDLQSMDADGFTLVVDDVMPRDLRVHYQAVGGDSLTNVASGQFIEPAAAGDQDVTSLAFQPDCVLFFSSGDPVAPPVGQADSLMMVGAAVSSTQRACWLGDSNASAATMQAISYCIGTECIVLPASAAGTITARADFVSFLSNGFRINWIERSLLRYIHFLAFKGGNFAVGNLLTQTDTVTDIVETGLGFQPTSALFLSHGQAASTADTPQDHDRLSIGAFSGVTTRGAQGTLDEDNLADSEVSSAIEFDEVYVNIALDSTIDGLMDVKSIDSDGFTMIMDNADPAQAFVWYLAFGAASAAGTILRQMMAHHGD